MPYTDENWRRFFETVDCKDLAENPMFRTLAGRSQNISTLLEVMAGILSERSTEYWIDLCSRLDIPCARLNRLEDLELDPHLKSVNFFQSLPFSDHETFNFTRAPIRMSDSYVEPKVPPRLGEHTEEILSDLAGKA